MRRVDLVHLRKSFDGVRALDSVDLSLDPGEQLALLGPSGSGKSTLLRLVAGLERPDEGDVRFDGGSVLDLAPHRRDVALVFQQYALYPHLSALENITLGLRHGLGLSARDAHARAIDVAGRLGIDDLLARRPRAMSGGQRQRVALARALARQAGVVLLDEPLSGLDAQLRLTLRVEIARHLRSSGVTVIHVTHDQSDAMTSADRIAVIDAGRIAQIGNADELYGAPSSLFVGRFLGTPPMNVFRLGADGRSPFGTHAQQLAGPVSLGVRPEHLRLDDLGPWRAGATVVATELNGPDQIVHLTNDDQICAARVPVGVRYQPGERLALSVDPSHVHVFSGPAEARIGMAQEHALLLETSRQPMFVS
jgi:multiple sugar transport system ATP-binding protein